MSSFSERWPMLLAPALIALASLPMALDLVVPNGAFGYRTAASMASEAAWYRANRAAGIAGVAGGIVGTWLVYRMLRREMSERARTLRLVVILLVMVAAIFSGGQVGLTAAH